MTTKRGFSSTEWQGAPAQPDAAGPPMPVSHTSGAKVERLYREHNESLVRFLRARLRSDADAREAAQEAYVRLLGLDNPDQPSFVRAYLFRVAANVATDVLRRKAVARRNATPADQDDIHSATQERRLSAKQDLERIDRALLELPPRCRAAFMMSRFEGCRTGDIACRLGVSERMVRQYLVRSLEHLQRAIQLTTGPGPMR